MENIIHPVSGNTLSIFSIEGRELLKSYLRNYKNGGGIASYLTRQARKLFKRSPVKNTEPKEAQVNFEAASKALAKERATTVV